MLDDLMAETAVLEAILDPLPAGAWEAPTLSEGWLVRDQVSHLASTDELATLAASDEGRFAEKVAEVAHRGIAFVDDLVADARGMPAGELNAWFRSARRDMVAVFAALGPKARVPWFGPAMSAVSFATARFMETWAHGQDVADAVGAEWPVTGRIRHVAEIGVRALPNSFRANRRPVPEAPVRVELAAPGGSVWAWGPADAADRLGGPARDFCLLVTQRRHRDDLGLVAQGPVAREWMGIAQAFAGPGTQPAPGRGA